MKGNKREKEQVMQKPSLPTSHQQTGAQPVSEQQPPCKDQNPRFCCWARCRMVQSIPLVYLGQLSWLCRPCQPLAHLQPRCLGARGRSREGPDAVEAPFSSSPGTGVLLALFQPEIPSTAPYRLLWRKLISSPPDAAQFPKERVF